MLLNAILYCAMYICLIWKANHKTLLLVFQVTPSPQISKWENLMNLNIHKYEVELSELKQQKSALVRCKSRLSAFVWRCYQYYFIIFFLYGHWNKLYFVPACVWVSHKVGASIRALTDQIHCGLSEVSWSAAKFCIQWELDKGGPAHEFPSAAIMLHRYKSSAV